MSVIVAAAPTHEFFDELSAELQPYRRQIRKAIARYCRRPPRDQMGIHDRYALLDYKRELTNSEKVVLLAAIHDEFADPSARFVRDRDFDDIFVGSEGRRFLPFVGVRHAAQEFETPNTKCRRRLAHLVEAVPKLLASRQEPEVSNGATATGPGETAATRYTTWQEAAKRLEQLRSQGDKFTSQPKLAEQLLCSVATVNKAIRKTSTLRVWAGVDKPKAARFQSLTRQHLEEIEQKREANPNEWPSQDEIDEALNYAIQQADDPGQRARIHAMTPEEQRQFAIATYKVPQAYEALTNRYAVREHSRHC